MLSALSAALLGLTSIPWTSAQLDDDMGPAAFLWPSDRAYSSAWDNTAPCGSAAGVSNRTDFPMSNGAVAIVLQDDSYSVNLAISYSSDPTSNSNFTTLVPGTDFPEIEPGHECYSVPNPPSTVSAGSNATLQLSYISAGTTGVNKTYYVCADIKYVELADFTTDIPCFNVTEDSAYETSAAGVETTASATSTSASATSTSGSSTSSDSSNSSSTHKGLSGGAIAGIVIGSIAGAAIIGAVLWFAYRAHMRRIKRETAVQLRMNELTNTHKVGTAASETSGEHH
ncbi:hypothetical protein EDD37DRAFT_165044 [Exophiala viscosa]|uniref:Copper acquisition factor BIM1-like domain-containing protein n=1 Tax=Exophiala viscosa TaxID=2486360 RepID=A0AAN6DQA7_9EURO|nr:hypothetical protein EDD36DRAFT_66230 [Exophiala viscosa]KAI1620695.1 hypothetical protein EDD37DRAFT_165044 [Exophiala viscosa]